MRANILIVDDEPQMRKSLANLLRREGYVVAEASGGQEGADRIRSEAFDLVITDLMMEPVSGLDLLRVVKEERPEIEVIVISAFGTIASAVDAMKMRAFDFITKPFNVDEILHRVRNALEKSWLREEVQRLRSDSEKAFGIAGIIGQSTKMQDLLSVVKAAARTEITVLIQGETGTGKELIAKAIHHLSRRSARRFVAINCGALHETLLESELFGHEKGAFTGATAQRKGVFEFADGGTLFLDEVGEISASSQVKLLRVLQEGELQRVGGSATLEVDVRIVAATNRDLAELVSQGRVRQDLFYRLNVFAIVVPPLRDRADDIPPLAAHFIEKGKEKIGKEISGVSPQAMALLMAYDWPGNVRELENVVQRAMIVAAGEILEVDDLPAEVRGPGGATAESARDLKEIARETSGMVERKAILDALEKNRGNVTHAAKALGVSRATLQNKMKLYGLRK